MHVFRRSLIALSLGLACASGFAQNDAPVKVGLLSTLSGPGAGLGVDIRDGFQLAVKLSGGKFSGKAVDVIVADDQASPDVGRQTADRLVKRDKVDFMTGIVFSNVMLAVGAPTFQSKTFYISANAGPSQYAGEQCNPYFFSASYQNDNMHEAVGKVVTDKGFKKVALIAPNYPAGKDAIAGFKRFFKGEVASETYTALNQLDYGTELSKLRATKPDGCTSSCPAAWVLTSSSSLWAQVCPKTSPCLAPVSQAMKTSSKLWATRCWACSTPRNGATTWTTRPTKNLWLSLRKPMAACPRCTPPKAMTLRA